MIRWWLICVAKKYLGMPKEILQSALEPLGLGFPGPYGDWAVSEEPRGLCRCHLYHCDDSPMEMVVYGHAKRTTWRRAVEARMVMPGDDGELSCSDRCEHDCRCCYGEIRI